jgi:predicted  nucleic acid-binding Zn-ribbon protein
MAQIECANCSEKWDLGTAVTNRCPNCGWITEIYYDESEAIRVRDIYNETLRPNSSIAGVRKLIAINGYSVSFPDEGRLREVAESLLERKAE